MNSQHSGDDQILADTYSDPGIHDMWEAIYRDDIRQDRLNDRILDHVLQVLAPTKGSLFLDAGCGVGDHTVRLVRLGYRCVGVDISPGILERAKARTARYNVDPPRYVAAPIEQLPFRDGELDYVHCRGVLMHIPNWQRALEELCRVVRPGGGIILMENNNRSLEHRVVMLARRIRRPRSEHRRTESGDEFWSSFGGKSFVVRTSNVASIVDALKIHDFETLALIPTEFVDIGRVPVALRNLVISVNSLCVALKVRWSWCSGVAIVATKRSP
jgi:SAM-dependent methyltransferase